jgi:hypothetical protein
MNWLGEFFSEGNQLDLEKIQRGGYKDKSLQLALQDMLRRIENGHLPFSLPCVNGTPEVLCYVVSENKRELKELSTILYAYLGSVRTTFIPQVFTKADNDLEDLILEKFDQGFLKIIIPNELNDEKTQYKYPDKSTIANIFNTITGALERYSERPLSVGVTKRPIGRVLSDFFVACERNNSNLAQELFVELKSSGQISPRNLRSVELQAFAAGYEWEKVIHHPYLVEIFLDTPVSGNITDILFQALQNTYLGSSDPRDYQLEELREQLNSFSDFFRISPDSKSSENRWKIWAIGAAALNVPLAFEETIPEIVGKEWVTGLVEWAKLHPSEPKNQFILEEALIAAPSIENAVRLLQYSLELLSSEDGRKIYNRLSEYPLETHQEIKVRGPLLGAWSSLQTDFGAYEKINGWSAWLESVIENDPEKLSIQGVGEAWRHWDKDKWSETELSDQFERLAESGNSSELRDAIPVLRKWLIHNEIKPSADFTERLLTVLALDEVYSVQDLALTALLITDLLGSSHTKNQYKDVIDAAILIWGRAKGVNSLEEGFEIIDILLDSLCADEKARLKYWNALQKFCLAEWERLKDSQRLIAQRTSVDLTGSLAQFPSEWKTEESESRLEFDFTNKKLALYTLTEKAGQRARDTLKELFPEIQIELNHDKTSTDALVNLAKTADYFIFSSGSATHQAFNPVKKSSSMVNCFLQAIQV